MAKAKRDVEINITGNTADARASMKDLESTTKRSFSQMSADAKKEADEISDAFKKSGIRTEAEIKQSSRDARRHYEKIKKSGESSANDIARAHSSMTAKIKRNNRELNKGNNSVFASFKKIKGGLAGTAGKIASIGGVIAAAFGVKAVGEAIKFEDALLDLQKVLSDSDGPATQFTKKAKEMALVYGVSAAKVLQSASDFKQAGFEVGEAFDLTENSLKLVVASELEAEEAATLLVQTLNGFKSPASEASRLINVLNATSEKYATNVKELGFGMRDIAGIAKKAGFSFEETAGLLTPVISVFGSGTEAAQALKSGLLKLISTQKPVVDELGRLGIHQRELNEQTGEYDGKLRSAKDILLDVSEAFQGMNENQKLATTGILAGTLQAGKMSEVFDGIGLSVEVTNNALKNTDSINKEVETRLKASSTQLDRLKTGFNNMAQAIGAEFLPAIKSAVDVLIPFFELMTVKGTRAALHVQKAWTEMSWTINQALGVIAKATDFIGLTSNASETVAADSEKLKDRLVAIDTRLIAVSDEGIAQAAKVKRAKDAEIEAIAAQNAATETRKQKIAEENAIMMQQVEMLTKVHNARKQAAAEFVGPPERPSATFFPATSSNVKRFKTGGSIPGYGGGDKVPALLESGEHVIRKESVKKIGRSAAHAFNRGDVAGLINSLPVQKYKEGGEVKSEGSTANVNLIMGDNSYPVTAAENVAADFIAEIKNINVIRSRKKNPY